MAEPIKPATDADIERIKNDHEESCYEQHIPVGSGSFWAGMVFSLFARIDADRALISELAEALKAHAATCRCDGKGEYLVFGAWATCTSTRCVKARAALAKVEP